MTPKRRLWTFSRTTSSQSAGASLLSCGTGSPFVCTPRSSRGVGGQRRQNRIEVECSRDKGGRDFVASHFAQRDFDNVRQGVAVENFSDSGADIEHQHAQAAMVFVWTSTTRVGRLADARDRSEWSINQSDDGAELDAVHGAGQRIAAVFSALAHDKTARFQLGKDLLEKLDWKFLFRGQLADLEDGPSQLGRDSEVNEGAQCIFATFGKLHATRSRSRSIQQL